MPKRRPLPSASKPTKLDSSLAIVNIVLLLIFFFLSTGSLLNSETVTVTLPDTTELPLDSLPKPLLLVSSDKGLTLDGVNVPEGGLSEALDGAPILHVLADRDTNAVAVLEALSAENLIAVEIRLVTLHLNEKGEG